MFTHYYNTVPTAVEDILPLVLFMFLRSKGIIVGLQCQNMFDRPSPFIIVSLSAPPDTCLPCEIHLFVLRVAAILDWSHPVSTWSYFNIITSRARLGDGGGGVT